jgi:hypothetical protein
MPSVIPGATNLMMSTSAEPKEHEIPIPPTPEQVVGYVNPYRGMEEHGVEHTAEFEDTPVDENTLHTFDKPESEPEPIPVKIVSSGGREFRTWNVRREYANPAGSGASRILGQDETRTKAKLGYPIGTNVEFEYNQEGDVWAVTDDPAAQPIAIVVEYAVRE